MGRDAGKRWPGKGFSRHVGFVGPLNRHPYADTLTRPAFHPSPQRPQSTQRDRETTEPDADRKRAVQSTPVSLFAFITDRSDLIPHRIPHPNPDRNRNRNRFAANSLRVAHSLPDPCYRPVLNTSVRLEALFLPQKRP